MMILHPITSRREALNKLKMFWALNKGSDYLRHLRGLRKDISNEHKSSEALDLEIEWVESVHQLFIKWTNTNRASVLRQDLKSIYNPTSTM